MKISKHVLTLAVVETAEARQAAAAKLAAMQAKIARREAKHRENAPAMPTAADNGDTDQPDILDHVLQRLAAQVAHRHTYGGG